MTDLNEATTVKDLMQLCSNLGAGSLKIILRDDSDAIIGACIVTNGEDETREILEAVEPIEDAWALAMGAGGGGVPFGDCDTCKNNTTNTALDPCHACLQAGEESPGYDPK